MKLILLIICFALAACDSPMNNRVRNVEDEKSASEKSGQFTNYNYSIKAQWLKGPTGSLTQTNDLLVIIEDKDGNRTSLPETLELNFYATMPSMGHAMDDAGFFEEVDTGLYLNKTIRFNMPGDWKIELWLLDENFDVKDQMQWHEFL